MNNEQAKAAALSWHGEAGGELLPQLTANELAGIVNEAIQQAAVPEGWASPTNERLLDIWKACKSIDNREFCVEFGRAVIAEMRIAQNPELTCWFGKCTTVEACAEDGCKTGAASPAPPKQQPALGRGDGGGVPLSEEQKRCIAAYYVISPEMVEAIYNACNKPTGQINPDSAGQGMEAGE